MSSPQDVLEAVATSLAQVDGLRTHSTVPGSVAPPAAIVDIASITAPTSLGLSAEYRVRVTLLVQVGDQRNSQVRTLDLIDPLGTVTKSAFAALLDHAAASQVLFEGPGLVEHGGQQFSGGIFTVTIYA